jgi:hypothetical protein
MLAMAMACHVLHAAEPALQRRSLLGDRVSMLVPTDFTQMSAEMVVKKYPIGNPPDLVYTNADHTVNVGLGHTMHRVRVDELAMALEAMKTGFKTVAGGRQQNHRIDHRQVATAVIPRSSAPP